MDFVAMPDGFYIYNGSGTPCDMVVGHCQCGATHHGADDAIPAIRLAHKMAMERANEASKAG